MLLSATVPAAALLPAPVTTAAITAALLLSATVPAAALLAAAVTTAAITAALLLAAAVPAATLLAAAVTTATISAAALLAATVATTTISAAALLAATVATTTIAAAGLLAATLTTGLLAATVAAVLTFDGAIPPRVTVTTTALMVFPFLAALGQIVGDSGASLLLGLNRPSREGRASGRQQGDGHHQCLFHDQPSDRVVVQPLMFTMIVRR